MSQPLPWKRQIQSASELEPLVKDLLALRQERTLWLLEGEVGAGKTEAVKTLARVLKLPFAASPSYAIHHRYENSTEAVDHLDLYRLESEEDLESTGFWDLFSASRGLIVIEWADQLNWEFLPKNWTAFHLRFEKGPGVNDRTVFVNRISPS